MTWQRRGPIDELLDDVWRPVADLDGGEVATYIRGLAKADPATFGPSLATLDGQVRVAGDLVPFTIESVSQPFVYAVALADRGHDAVLAKVGMSGGVAAALPGQLGLGVHSPLLDPRGNSVRGVAAAERLSRTLGLHLLLPSERTRSGLRRSYRDDVVRSRRGRPRRQRELLDAEGSAIAVNELAGDQGFASVGLLVRLVLDDTTPTRWRVLDLRRVTRIDTAAVTLLRSLSSSSSRPAWRSPSSTPVPTPRAPRRGPSATTSDGSPIPTPPSSGPRPHSCAATASRTSCPTASCPSRRMDLLHDLAPEVVGEIESRTTTRVFTAGAVALEEGAEADGPYFVGAGQVSVDVRIRRSPGRRRLTTIAAGSSFGELAIVDGLARSTRISALEPTICHVLTPEAFAALRTEQPVACAELTLAIARSLSQRLRCSTADVAAFEET